MIFDEQGNVVASPDLAAGYLKEDTRVIRHDAVAGVAEISHTEVSAVYPGGGRDLLEVIDVPGVPAQDAWDETEHILRYVPYTRAELDAIAAQSAARATLEDRMNQAEAALIELAALISGGGAS